MVKLVAVDLDGTLLNKKGIISPYTASVINTIQEKGIEFVVCTGRDYSMSLQPLVDAGISCDFICASGASTYKADGSIHEEIYFTHELANSIKESFEKRDIYMELFTSEGRMTNFTPEKAREYLFDEWMDTQIHGKILHDKEECLYFANVLMETTKKEVKLEEVFSKGTRIYKICTAKMDIPLITELREELSKINGISVEFSYAFNAEITVSGAQKGAAVARYAKAKGIEMNEVMVIGDSENDRSMLAVDFGYTVAMGNASESIKKLAKFITTSNEEDGVAYAIENYVLKP